MTGLMAALITIASSVVLASSDFYGSLNTDEIEESQLEQETEASRASELKSTQREHERFEAQVNKDIRKARGQSLSLNRKNQNLEQSIANGRRRIEVLQVTKGDLNNQVNKLSRVNRNLSATNTSLKEKREKLSAQIAENRSGIREQNTMKRDLARQNVALSNQIKFNQAQLRYLERRLAQAKYQRRVQQNRLATLNKKARQTRQALRNSSGRSQPSQGTASIYMD